MKVVGNTLHNAARDLLLILRKAEFSALRRVGEKSRLNQTGGHGSVFRHIKIGVVPQLPLCGFRALQGLLSDQLCQPPAVRSLTVLRIPNFHPVHPGALLRGVLMNADIDIRTGPVRLRHACLLRNISVRLPGHDYLISLFLQLIPDKQRYCQVHVLFPDAVSGAALVRAAVPRIQINRRYMRRHRLCALFRTGNCRSLRHHSGRNSFLLLPCRLRLFPAKRQRCRRLCFRTLQLFHQRTDSARRHQFHRYHCRQTDDTHRGGQCVHPPRQTPFSLLPRLITTDIFPSICCLSVHN